MVDRDIFPALASRLLDTLRIEDGDAVLVMGGAHQAELLEEIGVQVARKGGQPFLHYVSDAFRRRMLETCTVEQHRRTPKIFKAAVEATDALVILEPYSDPTIRTGFREKAQAVSHGMHPIQEIIYGRPGKPWVFIGWATEPMARMYGVPLPVLEKLVIGSCNVDYRALALECRRLMAALEGVKYVHATDPLGTDFRLCIEGRRLNADDGLWSPEKEAAGDTGGNLPAGEVFVAPVETYGEGTIYCPATTDELTRSTLIRGALLHFEAGMLVPDRCTAAENQDILRDTLEKFVELDMHNHGAPNALKVAELGVGLNPAIDRAIGYILTDEKIGGSVHVAFGLSSDLGGNVVSSMHWDFVTAPGITLEAERVDGSKRLLMKDGRLIV